MTKVLICFYRVKGQYYERVVLILSFLFDCLGDHLQTTLGLLLRNAYFQESNSEMISFINILVDFFTLRKEKIGERCDKFLAKIMFKMLRLMSVTMLYKESSDLHHKLVFLVRYIWEKHRKGIPSLL